MGVLFKIFIRLMFLPFYLFWWFLKAVYFFMVWLEVCLLGFNASRLTKRR